MIRNVYQTLCCRFQVGGWAEQRRHFRARNRPVQAVGAKKDHITRKHLVLGDVHFYEEYLAFCKRLAESNIVKPQSELPGPTPLRTLDRALWEWSRSHTG